MNDYFEELLFPKFPIVSLSRKKGEIEFLSPLRLESILAHRHFLFNQRVIRSFFSPFVSRVSFGSTPSSIGELLKERKARTKGENTRDGRRSDEETRQARPAAIPRYTQTYRGNSRNFHEGSGISRWRIFAYRIRRKKIEIWELVRQGNFDPRAGCYVLVSYSKSLHSDRVLDW